MLTYGIPVPIDEVKAAGDSWEVTGYCSTYGNRDLGDDVVMPGAFDDWLAAGKRTRFLFSHRPDMILGTLTEMKSDAKGLFVRGRISKTALGQDVHTLLRDQALDSFSIGYLTRDADRKDGVRYLKQLDLPETSLVALPMNEEATVTAVKSVGAVDIFAYFWDRPDEAEAMLSRLVSKHTLVERAGLVRADLESIGTEFATLAGKGRDLNAAKRQELANLLETFSGLDAVRSELAGLLATDPVHLKVTGTSDGVWLRLELARRRARLAGIN
jgi:hypothetical protein